MTKTPPLEQGSGGEPEQSSIQIAAAEMWTRDAMGTWNATQRVTTRDTNKFDFELQLGDMSFYGATKSGGTEKT
jgi:hypothetical protein